MTATEKSGMLTSIRRSPMSRGSQRHISMLARIAARSRAAAALRRGGGAAGGKSAPRSPGLVRLACPDKRAERVIGERGVGDRGVEAERRRSGATPSAVSSMRFSASRSAR